MTTKPKRTNKKNTGLSHREAALKRQIDRLQIKYENVEAKLFAAESRLRAQAPIIKKVREAAEKKAQSRKDAMRALSEVGDISELL